MNPSGRATAPSIGMSTPASIAISRSLQHQQRAELRERRTLRAAPGDASRTRRGRVTQPAPWVAAPGTLLALEAQLHFRSSANLKAQSRLDLFARQHCCCPTESEALLWSALKAQQLGVSFRRQVPVASQFIADFFASAIGLIVEVDGAIHARKRGSDARRDLKLRRAGFRVVRVSATLVLSDLPAALALVRAAL